MRCFVSQHNWVGVLVGGFVTLWLSPFLPDRIWRKESSVA